MVRVFTLVIITVVIGMFIGGVSPFISEFDDTYNLNLTESQFSTFDRIDSVQANLTKQIQEDIEIGGAGEQRGENDIIVAFAKGAFASIKLIFEIPIIMISLVIDGFALLPTAIGIPVVFLSGIIALITVVVGFGVLYAFFKTRF